MPKDCIILVADLDAENAIKGLLSRPAAIGCRSFDFDLFRHPRRDPGVRLESKDFLRPFCTSYERAVLILDRHGSGAETKSSDEIELEIEKTIAVDWRQRAVAIVIDPELEAWVWSDSPEVEHTLGWQGRTPALREWLLSNNLLQLPTAKPADPKRAYERALFHVGKTRSASIFKLLGERVSTRRCADRSFIKLRDALCDWFPMQL